MQLDFGAIKYQIINIYKQDWYRIINNSPRLETYNLFKLELEYEKYLSVLTEKKFRLALARFRISSHELHIEHGRHTNTPRNQRLCLHCNNQQIENEHHFLLICQKYTQLRKKYLPRFYHTWPTVQKFRQLLEASNKKIIIISQSIYILHKSQDQINYNRRHTLYKCMISILSC